MGAGEDHLVADHGVRGLNVAFGERRLLVLGKLQIDVAVALNDHDDLVHPRVAPVAHYDLELGEVPRRYTGGGNARGRPRPPGSPCPY